MTTSSLTIPYWLALLPSLILPEFWLKRHLSPSRRGLPIDPTTRLKPAQPPARP
jgi:hypothetical protein